MKKIIKLENGQKKVVTINDLPSRTQQNFKDQCNINNIMKKYHVTGMVNHLNNKKGTYADLTQVKDFQGCLQTVIDAQASFMTIPSEIRKKFGNDPQALIEFLKDPKNKDEAIQLGLMNKPIIQEDTQKEILKELKKQSKNDDSNDDKNKKK